MKIITIDSLTKIIKMHGLENFLKDLIARLKTDFGRWEEFNKMPRPAMYVPRGVLELMPVCDGEYYTFKYVNCHPRNPESGLMTVVATGQLSRIDTGYPLMFSEMTLLTALRTAATTALATDLMARKDSSVLAIIGTGAQSEFLVKALCMVRGIKEVRYFDIDPRAMDKFLDNFLLGKLAANTALFRFVRCANAAEAVLGADIIITCTACKGHVEVLKNDWIVSGTHINGIGGDAPGKTELGFDLLERSRIVVEYFDQCLLEGEIQRYSKEEAKVKVYAEMHEIVTGKKKGRESEDEITLFDSVGIGLEDYSVLRLTYELSEKYGIGEEMDLIPGLADPKNLISLIV
jgi:ornithine cyclodeaminase